MKKSILAICFMLMSTVAWSSNYCNHGCNENETETSSGDATATATADANVDVNIDLTVNNASAPSESDQNVNTYYIHNEPEDIVLSNDFSNVMASMSAMANIPALQHVTDDHAHSGAGVGVGVYNDKVAMAVGFLHQYDVFSFKATVSKAKSAEAIWGAGTTVSW